MVSYATCKARRVAWTSVLILVVVEDGLVLPLSYRLINKCTVVLILVVVEDGLVLLNYIQMETTILS